MITPFESKILDLNSEELGIPVSKLMRNAGKTLAETVNDVYGDKKILVVCGTGNNGGDGYAAAKYLPKNQTTVAYFSEPKTEAAKKYFKKLTLKKIKFGKAELKDFDVIVDCVLGTGLHGKLREPYAGYIDKVNKSGLPVVSCDVPSGFGTDKKIKPKITVTFHDIKEGMNEKNCGSIIIADIGIPKKAWENVGKGDLLRYPIPKESSHKGQNGRLLIVGGGPYTGAPALAGLAALRTGVDLVHVATPEPSFVPVASASPSFVMHKITGNVLSPDSVDSLLKLSDSADAVLIGPGLGTSEETVKAVSKFVNSCKKPMVVDADGITAISKSKIKTKKKIVFTPHKKEFEKLTSGTPENYAKKNNCVIVLKGKKDLITDGTVTRYNTSGNAAMTVGGTGDALSGTVAGLLAKGMNPFDSGCVGTYLCGKAGEKAFKKYSYGLTAEDLAKEISKILRKSLDR